MSFLRRAALRALSARPLASSPALLSSVSRPYVSCAPSSWKPQPQWTLTHFRRTFSSDETKLAEEDDTKAADAAEETVTATDTEDVAAGVGSTFQAPGIDNSAVFPPKGGASRVGLTPHNKTLYVGNLSWDVTEDDLRRFFIDFGTITSVKLIYTPDGRSRGFGYVDFAEKEGAARAIEARDQYDFHGRRVTVQYHHPREMTSIPRPPNPPSRTLYIGNMSFEMSDKDLNDLFREVRGVLDVRVAIDRRSGQPRGFAHADFVDVQSAMAAKDFLEGKMMHGRQFKVDYSSSSSDRYKPNGGTTAEKDGPAA